MSVKSDDTDFTMLAMLIVAPIIALGLIPVLLWNGWAASVLWGWFIVPTFGAPAISISQAAGMALVVGAFRFKLSSPKDETSLSMKIIAVLIGPPLAVGLGWVVKWTAL